MLTLPDFREKKIVTIFADKDIESRIKFWNSNIRLFKDGKPEEQISCHLVLAIYIIGSVTITSNLIEKAKKYGISIHLLNHSFRSVADISSSAEGNYALRTKQYTCSKEFQLELAKNLILNKVQNQINLLKEYGHDRAANQIEETVYPLIATARNEKILLGVEGNAANIYFKALFAHMEWNRRAPQTREDIPNFLMDIGYSFLFNYVDSLLRLFGFDTYKGFYHKLFFQRKSLSCDLMEPIRCEIDKALVKAYNLGRINPKEFTFKNGSFLFKPGKDIRQKYTSIFFWALHDNREEIYAYLRHYYLHIMLPEKYQFPIYKP